jgi:ATP-dependent Lon protease
MEIITLPGYTEDEKLHIAQGYLVPRQLKEHGLDAEKIAFDADGIRSIIREYTREAGVRSLEREIATICRKVARRYAEGETTPVRLTPDVLSTYLGPARFEYGMVEEKEDAVGAATGVSVSEYGGDVLTVEATVIEGKVEGDKDFMITGQVGKVMEESARAALSYVRAREPQLGIPQNYFDNHAVHIHVPAGAIPKDGPSAGVTMMTALVSALTGRRVRRDVAMTGEITLRGKVLPIGGVKEKLLAAHRAGIKTFILPQKNKKDLVDVPKEVQDEVAITLVSDASEVLQIALQQPVAPSRADEPVPASVAAAGPRTN